MYSHAQIRKDYRHRHKKYKVAKVHRKPAVDSFQLKRNQTRDSILAIRKYRESRHYRDSVSRSVAEKVEALKTGRVIAAAGITSKSQSKSDSIKFTMKHRSDSLARVKKYKSSKRYSDSVTLARREHADSIKTVQMHFRDSIAAKRKKVLDSSKLARKHVMDSVKLVRTKTMDSIKIVRKAKSDSLAKAKADKEKLAKANEKKRQEAQKLKLEIKFNKKREAWSNQTMLKKKWSLFRQVIQNTFTHYNYYYNAKKRMDDAVTNMQRTRKENYDSLINLYSFDPNKDSNLVKGDMDTIIRKASVGLQIHDPRVKWANDLYLLLGEAYYYKGNYKNATTAFRYIIAKDEETKKKEAAAQSHYGEKSKEEPTIVENESASKLDFLKHKSVHNESILWLARTYTSSHMIENSESVVSLLESDSHLPDDLKGRVAAEKAFAYLAEHNNQAAIAQLQIVTDDDNLPDILRMRAAFLRGQLLQNEGSYGSAVTSFEGVLTFYPKIDMDFYARKYIAYNSLLAGDDAATAMRPLKKVLNDGKYVNYYDQVYFVLGKLAIKAGKTDDAVTYLNKSIYTPKATKKQKAMSFAALGDAYYTDAKYRQAKLAYDSATKYAAGIKDTIGLSTINRGKTLDAIVGPATVIHDQDSLLALAELSPKEQLSVVRHYLKYLEKLQEDSIANAENAAAAGAGAAPETAPETSDYSSWYFSNPTQIQQGSADFKRKWGNRALTDNWRRAAGTSLSASGNEEVAETPDDKEAIKNGLPSEKYLLAKIPNTLEQKIQAAKTEQKAYIKLAKAYFNEFDDFGNATNTLDNLDTKYPDHNQKEEELYLRYQIAFRQSQWDKAQSYSRQLLEQFPNSEYAKLLRPKEGNKSEAQGAEITVAKYYDETYNLLLKHQYSEALVHIEAAKKQYDNPVFKKRFLVAEAMALAGAGNLDKADTAIAGFLHSYHAPDTLVEWANSIKNYIAEIRKNGVPSWYKESPPGEKKPEIALTDSAAIVKDTGKTAGGRPEPKPKIPEMYQNNPKDPHYCIVMLPGIDSRVTALRKNILSFDSAQYGALNLEIVLDYFDFDKTVLVVKRFTDADASKAYMSVLMASTLFKDFKSSEYQSVIISAPNYLKLYGEKKIDAYMSFYNAVYK